METARNRPQPGPRAGEDALQLIKAGSGFLVAGAVCVLLIVTAFGGIRAHGPETNGGWLLLVVALMCLPLGLLLLALGGAKRLGRRP
jgi:hypothetical protein